MAAVRLSRNLCYSYFLFQMWGGKRSGAGPKKRKERDWNKYKLDAKRKKMNEVSKSNQNIQNFFTILHENPEPKESNLVEENKTSDARAKLMFLDANENVRVDLVRGVTEKDISEHLAHNEDNLKVDPSDDLDDPVIDSKSTAERFITGEGMSVRTVEEYPVNEGSINQEILTKFSQVQTVFGNTSLEVDDIKASDNEFLHPSPSSDGNIPLGSPQVTQLLELTSVLPSPLPFFVNGCFASGILIVHDSNFSFLVLYHGSMLVIKILQVEKAPITLVLQTQSTA